MPLRHKPHSATMKHGQQQEEAQPCIIQRCEKNEFEVLAASEKKGRERVMDELQDPGGLVRLFRVAVTDFTARHYILLWFALVLTLLAIILWRYLGIRKALSRQLFQSRTESQHGTYLEHTVSTTYCPKALTVGVEENIRAARLRQQDRLNSNAQVASHQKERIGNQKEKTEAWPASQDHW